MCKYPAYGSSHHVQMIVIEAGFKGGRFCDLEDALI